MIALHNYSRDFIKTAWLSLKTDGAASAEPNLFELCRVVTEEGGSQPMEQRAQSQTCLSYAESWQRKAEANIWGGINYICLSFGSS